MLVNFKSKMFNKFSKLLVITSLASSAFICSAIPTPAMAEGFERKYISAGAGANYFGARGTIGIGGGGDSWRLETHYVRTGGGYYDTNAITATAFWDIPVSQRFYLSVGLKVGAVHFAASSRSSYYKDEVHVSVAPELQWSYELNDDTDIYLNTSWTYYGPSGLIGARFSL